MVLDGEMVVTDASGKTNFQARRTYEESAAQPDLYVLVSLAWTAGHWGYRLVDRK
jgi:hypothetical protein